MLLSCKCSVKTAHLARFGLKETFNSAFGVGVSSSVTSICFNVVALSVLLIVFQICNVLEAENSFKSLESLCSYALGTTFVALMTRLTGGLFDKATLYGGGYDLTSPSIKSPVGITKCSSNYVNNVLGLNSDLFATLSGLFCGYFILLGRYTYKDGVKFPKYSQSFTYLSFPLLLLTFCVVFSLIVGFLFKLFYPLTSSLSVLLIYFYMVLSTVLLVLSFLPLLLYLFLPNELVNGLGYSKYKLFGLFVLGLFSGVVVFCTTLLFTNSYFYPSRSVSNSFIKSPINGLLCGLSYNYLSSLLPVLLLTFIVLLSFYTTDIYGITFTNMGLLCSLTVVLIMGTFNPIVLSSIELLDGVKDDTSSLGVLNTLGSLSPLFNNIVRVYNFVLSYLVGFTLFCSYMDVAKVQGIKLLEPFVYVCGLLGLTYPFFLSGIIYKFLHLLSNYVLNNGVKDEITDSLSNVNKYTNELTLRSLLCMILPAVLSLVLPVGLGTAFGKNALTSYVFSVHLVGVVLVILLTNSGTLWENTHRYTSSGKLGTEHGKGSPTNKSTGTFNLLGELNKDLLSPVLSLLIVLTPLVSLVFARVVRKYCSDDNGYPFWIKHRDTLQDWLPNSVTRKTTKVLEDALRGHGDLLTSAPGVQEAVERTANEALAKAAETAETVVKATQHLVQQAAEHLAKQVAEQVASVPSS